MRRWCVILKASDELGLPNMLLRYAWTEAGAWRWARRRFTRGVLGGTMPDHHWLEVRRRSEWSLTTAVQLDTELARLKAER